MNMDGSTRAIFSSVVTAFKIKFALERFLSFLDLVVHKARVTRTGHETIERYQSGYVCTFGRDPFK
jgi:hypothetical protein